MSHLGKLLLAAGRPYVPENVGEAWQGGYYVGRMSVNNENFALVVAPQASGYVDNLALCSAATNLSGFSRWNGAANMALMIADGISKYPAGNWARNLSIGGFTDWHLPAEDQLDMCYRSFRPPNAVNTNWGENPSMVPPKGNYTGSDPVATTIPAFQSGGPEAFTANFYATTSPATNTSNHKLINFNGGNRVDVAPTANRMWRAVRLVRI